MKTIPLEHQSYIAKQGRERVYFFLFMLQNIAYPLSLFGAKMFKISFSYQLLFFSVHFLHLQNNLYNA